MQPRKLRLGVNIDHVATIRNARGGRHPDPVKAAVAAAHAGADGITAHLREDRRHITDGDIEQLIGRLPELCAPGAVAIWTRHRLPPDLTPSIRGWFERAGFDEVGFDAPEGELFSVGANRLRAPPRPLEPGVRLFRFVGLDVLRAAAPPRGDADDLG